VRLLIHPAFTAGRLGLRIFQGATERALGLLERMLGMAFLRDLSEFLLAFEAMAEGFRARATRVRAMLLGPEAGFVLVAAPSFHAARNAETFLVHLAAEGVPLVGVVINRVRRWPSGTEEALPPADEATDAADRDRLARALRDVRPDLDAAAADAHARAASEAATQYDALVQLDRESTAPLRRRAGTLGLLVLPVPELPEDVHDVDGLRRIGREIFGSRQLGGEATPSGEGMT
jgi:anion-transporting  ArsA/GET3 family ATPase